MGEGEWEMDKTFIVDEISKKGELWIFVNYCRDKAEALQEAVTWLKANPNFFLQNIELNADETGTAVKLQGWWERREVIDNWYNLP